MKRRRHRLPALMPSAACGDALLDLLGRRATPLRRAAFGAASFDVMCGEPADRIRANLDRRAGSRPGSAKHELAAAGCGRIFAERVSSIGARPEPEAAIAFAREGATPVVTKPDRLARSVADLLGIVGRLEAKGVALRVLSMGGAEVDTGTPTGRPMLTMLGAPASGGRASIASSPARRLRDLRQACRHLLGPAGGEPGSCPLPPRGDAPPPPERAADPAAACPRAPDQGAQNPAGSRKHSFPGCPARQPTDVPEPASGTRRPGLGRDGFYAFRSWI